LCQAKNCHAIDGSILAKTLNTTVSLQVQPLIQTIAKKLIVLCVHTTKALLDLTSNVHLSIFAQNDDIAFSCFNVLVLTRFNILGEDTNNNQQISKVYKH